MATNIPFPNVPEYPGVPQLMRAGNAAIASNPVISITLGSIENILITALQQPPKWGIFDQDGNQLGVTGSSQSTLSAISGTLLGQLTGSRAPVLSTFDLSYMRETRVSDFPIEAGSFASYNKVQMPANPVVTLILQGSSNDRTTLLYALEAACIGTDLYNVVTPDYIYDGYSIERFNYARRAQKGAELLIVEVSLKEIRQVTATLATAVTPIQAPVDAGSTPQTTNGIQQPQAAPQSLLYQIGNSNFLSMTNMFGGN